MSAFSIIPLGSVIPVFFDSFAGSTGASITISGLAITDIEIYKGTSMTQRSSDAGYVLLDTDGIDLDGITGIQGFSIDTGDNTDAGFYAAGSFYNVVVSAITVDSQTVNFVAHRFRLVAAENTVGVPVADTVRWNNLATVALPLIPTTAGRTLDVSAGGEAGVDWANIGSPTTTVNLSGTTISTVTNAVTTTATVQSGTAQAGSSNSITLSAGASATNGLYDPGMVRIISGTGAGQARVILQYVGATKVATVDRDWRTNPDNTSVYEVIATANLISTNEGLAQAGAASTITLNASASAVNNSYIGETITIRSGTGQDQSRNIINYVGATKVATVDEAWNTNPDSTSVYVIWPIGRAMMVSIANSAITANSIASNAITAAKIATDAIGAAQLAADAVTEIQSGLATPTNITAASGVALTSGERNSVADALLGRNVAGGSSTGRLVKEALYVLRNKTDISAGTLTVYGVDDTTSAFTAAVSTTAGNPISQIDPA